MLGERLDDASVHAQQPVLCQRCQHVVDTPYIRPLQTIEPRFLHNDYIPSKVEMSELKDLLKEGERELKRYEVDMALLQQTLEQLGNAKSAVETMAKQCWAAISAQRRVPVEIWEMIFSTLCLSLCEYSFDVNYRSHSPLLGLPAIIISQVCSHWRTIAKGLSKLWSSITVNLSEPPYDVGLPLEVYFSNSGDYPLKLRIQSDGPILESPWYVGLWESLSRHIHRSRELTMAVEFHDDFRDLPPIQRLTFPNLEAYRELEYGTPDESVWPWFWQAIQRSPKLVVFSGHHANRAIPFPQLTSWEVRDIQRSKDVDDFLDVARSCKALKSLTLSSIDSWGVRDNLPVAVREVNLPSLRQLTVRTYRDDYSWLPSICDSLVMPSLETCFIHRCTWLLPSALVDMVRRSSISLKQITLELRQEDPNSCRDPLLLDMLQAVPKLARFELTLGGVSSTKIRRRKAAAFTDDMVSALLSKFENGPPGFLPQLECLSLELPYVTLNTQLVKRILEVVSARQRTSHPLAEFRFVRLGPYPKAESETLVMKPELVKRIRMLDEGHVKVVIQDCTRHWHHYVHTTQ
ncbi:hypothetical protein E1B28_006952 [Marasmius oreades]|uniref:F-box domain-containing protein n=1 Tax=Marasmius oreades TaxID=181124 RepID=A0A9P7S0R0_9AGAR|nr:uncharacterized protein E1B28_006952 [Marasmius oreades]KAG7093269.1 hypothetical protein E1B28_006952 [Marasmius oreades]